MLLKRIKFCVMVLLVFAFAACFPAGPGKWGGPATPCEEALTDLTSDLGEDDCRNLLSQWMYDCAYNPYTDTCYCLAMFTTCSYMDDVLDDCGDCWQQARGHARANGRNREYDNIGKLPAVPRLI
jgi:hypothetical protein